MTGNIARLAVMLCWAGCAESPKSYGIQHDVGRLCVATRACDAPPCTDAIDSERGRMMSRWGQQIQPRLAVGEADARRELLDMIERSGVKAMSPTCKALADAGS